ncbi:MAG: hypothetical protein GDA67_16235 [Nitrospira sp. CR1.3]|nr:hypothetical protein [Nitrospira sp. CR1.3]
MRRCPIHIVPLVLFLCLCVMMQMLGTPGTLLSPTLASDIWGTSVLEGFSIPPNPAQPTPSASAISATEMQTFLHVPVLASAPFHPPLLQVQ